MPKRRKYSGPHLRRVSGRSQKAADTKIPPIEYPSQRRIPMGAYALFFGLILALLSPFIYKYYAQYEEHQNLIEAIQAPIIEKHSSRLKFSYPLGAQLIAIEPNSILKLPYDTLPNSVNINWKDTKVKSFETDKVTLVIPHLQYKQSVQEAEITFSRMLNETIIMVKIMEMELTLEILEDYGDRLIAVAGIRYR